MTRASLIVACWALVAGCDDDGPTRYWDGSFADSASADAASNADARPVCDRTPAPADRDRYAVISLPFATMDGTGYEVLELDTAGTLTTTGVTFDMRRAFLGEVAFTPDGEIGLVAQDDGTVGVFAIDASGQVTVIDAAYDSNGDEGFYIEEIVVHPDGQRALFLNSQWRKYGGGVWEAYIGCDGALEPARQVAAARLPYALAFVDGDTALVAAKDLLDSTNGDTAYLLDLGQPAVLDTADAFGHTDAIVSDMAITADGAYGLIADNSLASANSVARVALGDGSVTAAGTLAMFDPIDVVASPFDTMALVVTGEGDGLHYVDAATFTALTEVTYTGNPPSLPGRAVMIDRGGLRGRVLVAENQGVRQVDFADGAPPADQGLTSLGSIVGVIGVQP